MVLYIDETENEDYFIVAGLLVSSKDDVELSYKQFKNGLKGLKLKQKAKSKIFTEFKSTLLDRNYYYIKRKLLFSLSSLDYSVLFSCYRKKLNKMNQIQKESVYIALISNIFGEMRNKTEVIFDRFGLSKFESDVIKAAEFYDNIVTIYPDDSQKVHGLQYIDNLCSTIRLYLSGQDDLCYYDIIKKRTKEI